MSINEYESAVRSCFGENGIQSLWYGGTKEKIGDDPNKMYVAITEGADWWQNRCILRGWFFDYEKFETLPLEIDCETYGVYVIWMKRTPPSLPEESESESESDDEWCEEHEQPMWKDGLKCGGCLDQS
jgi:hypothetical protein